MDHLRRSLQNAFTGLPLNRKPFPALSAAEWTTLLQSERALFVITRAGDVLCDAVTGEPLLLDRSMLGGCAAALSEALLLGDDPAGTYFAINIGPLPDPTRSCLDTLGTFISLRQQMAILPPFTASLLGYACFASGWHARVRFCNACGHPTRMLHGTLAQVCTNAGCGLEHYPRVNPAMIVLVHRRDEAGDWCLLGRQAGWTPRVYSALAGYVEPGESAEDAVLREVREETGVILDAVRYHSSQPWPFSGSLMLGFLARAASTAIHLDDRELEDARWFSRQELPELIASGVLALPPAETISRHLFDAWYTDGICA